MAIKQTINYNVEEIFRELGHDYSDFINYLSTKTDQINIDTQASKLDYTLDFVLEEFTKSIQLNSLIKVKSKNTTKYYLSFIQRFQLFITEKHSNLMFYHLNEIVFNQFIEWTNMFNGKSLHPNSINTYLTIIRRLCTFAYENDYSSKNLNYKFRKIKIRTLPRYFSAEQLKNFFYELNKNPNGYLWRTIFITLLGTGLRISELVNLKIEDVDFKNKLIFTKGKGNKERYVPIYPEVEQAILSYLKTTQGLDIEMTRGYLFTREFGTNRSKKISVTSIQYNFLKVARELNFDEKLTVHSFRHTFAVNCLKADMQLVYLLSLIHI